MNFKVFLFYILSLVLLSCGTFQGKDGEPGLNSLVTLSRTTISSELCASKSGIVVNSGLDINRNNLLEESEYLKTQVLCDGNDASSEFNIYKVHDPCGDDPGKPDEVILELKNGIFLAWYKNLGLSVLEKEVNYVTTDDQKCLFKINSQGELELN